MVFIIFFGITNQSLQIFAYSLRILCEIAITQSYTKKKMEVSQRKMKKIINAN